MRDEARPNTEPVRGDYPTQLYHHACCAHQALHPELPRLPVRYSIDNTRATAGPCLVGAVRHERRPTSAALATPEREAERGPSADGPERRQAVLGRHAAGQGFNKQELAPPRRILTG